jgi:hypothetical protein
MPLARNYEASSQSVSRQSKFTNHYPEFLSIDRLLLMKSVLNSSQKERVYIPEPEQLIEQKKFNQNLQMGQNIEQLWGLSPQTGIFPNPQKNSLEYG